MKLLAIIIAALAFSGSLQCMHRAVSCLDPRSRRKSSGPLGDGTFDNPYTFVNIESLDLYVKTCATQSFVAKTLSDNKTHLISVELPHAVAKK